MTARRLRFRYSLAPEAFEFGQRELVAAWEAACERAGLSLAALGGRRPSSQISLAAPLPRNTMSDCELVDVVLDDHGPPKDTLTRVAAHLPSGLTALSVDEVGLHSPSIQSQVRWAEYEISVDGVDPEPLRQTIASLLDATSLPSEYRREKKLREYDLRPLILDLRLISSSSACPLVIMRLRAEPERSARADQVAAALGLLPETQIRRTRLVLEEISPALSAYRRAAQPEEI